MARTKTQVEPSTLLTDLLNKYKNPDVIEFEGLKFRYFTSSGEYNKVAQDAAKYAETIEKAKQADLVEMRTEYREDSVAAYLLKHLSVEPKLTAKDAFAIVKCPALCAAILNKLETARLDMDLSDVEEVEARKNELSETPGTQQD